MKKVFDTVGQKPSTVKNTFPKVYLGDQDKNQRIQSIKKEMYDYMFNEIFAPSEDEMIYLERTTKYRRVRQGLVTSVVLETSEFKSFIKSLIRATEVTVVERSPPFMEIRRNS